MPKRSRNGAVLRDATLPGGGRGGGGGESVTGAIPVVPVAEPVEPQIAAVSDKARIDGLMPRVARLEEQVRTLISNAAAAQKQTLPIDHLKKLNHDKPPHEPLIPVPHGGQAHPPFFPAGLTKSGIFTLTEAVLTAILEGYEVEFNAADTLVSRAYKLHCFLTGC